MEKVLLREYFIPAVGISKKVIYHFSDSHLTEYDSLSDEAETEKAKKQTEAWDSVRRSFPLAYGEPFGELQQQSPMTHFKNLMSVAQGGDAFVVAGDTLDYTSGANLRIADRLFGSATVKYIAVCGNHDKPCDIPDGYVFSKTKQPVQTLDLGDMLIVGIDNSDRLVTEHQLAELKCILEGEKPILIVMHVPIMTEGNAERLRKCGEYFQLNYDGCPKTNCDFIELIKKNGKKIIAVLAGHLHFCDVSEISPEVTQYVSSQGIAGNINRYIIGE